MLLRMYNELIIMLVNIRNGIVSFVEDLLVFVESRSQKRRFFENIANNEQQGGPLEHFQASPPRKLLTVGTFSELYPSPYAHRRKYPTGSTEIYLAMFRVHELLLFVTEKSSFVNTFFFHLIFFLLRYAKESCFLAIESMP